MRKLYYKLVRFIGYTILIHDHYNSSFELEKKYAYIGIYKFLGNFKHDGSLKMIRVWEIKIR
jgi:hypothetical protein